MYKNFKQLRIIRDIILENKLDSRLDINWMTEKRIKQISRLREELRELENIKQGTQKSRDLLKILNQSKINADVESINKMIEEVAYEMDLKIDELYYRIKKRKGSQNLFKKIFFGGLIASKVLFSGHGNINRDANINKINDSVIPQSSLEVNQQKKSDYSEENQKLKFNLNQEKEIREESKIQKERILLTKKQRKEIKMMTDITFAEVCEFGSPRNYKPEVIIAVASTILNRVEQRPREFGKTIEKVIHKKNAYYGLSNRMYKEAKILKFSTKENEQAYINIFRIVQELYLGNIECRPGLFFFKPQEIPHLEESPNFNFNLLEEEKEEFSPVGPYRVFSYKS